MSETNVVRRAIRMLFFTSLLSGLVLILLSLDVHADPTKPTPAESGGNNVVYRRTSAGTNDAPSTVSNEPAYTDMTREVLTRLQNEGQYIFGREAESDELDDVLAQSDAHAVVISGDPKSGRTGLVEENIRRNPLDKVQRLNIKRLSLMNDEDATAELKKIILDLENQNIAAAGDHRVKLFIDNLAALQRGGGTAPIQALWDQIIRGANLTFIIESDATTIAGQITGDQAKYKALAKVMGVLPVKPPAYDVVVSYLMQNRNAFEKNGVTASRDAIVNAARLSVSRGAFASNPFKYSFLMLQAAQRAISTQKAGGFQAPARLAAEVKQMQMMRDAVAQDLQHETSPAAQSKLTAELADLDSKLAPKKAAMAANVTSPLPQRLAFADVNLMDLTAAYELEKGKDPRSAATRQLAEKVKIATSDLHALEEEKLMSTSGGGRITTENVLAIAGKWLNLPPSRLTANLEEGLKRVQEIKKVIYGQDHVVDLIEARLMINRMHLNDGKELTPEEAELVKKGLIDDSLRPVGSFFFAGSTGVGKTEVAKQLANLIGYELVRFDMSEFMEKHYAAQLIGSPVGYEGHDTPGQLTEAVRLNPECVLLFDEIEKAHPDILNVLLQVLDDGKLKDNQGKDVDFRKVILIMTSNLAQKVARWEPGDAVKFLKETGKWTDDEIRNRTGYDKNKLRREAYKVYVTDAQIAQAEGRVPMKPEIVNRIDEVIMFNALNAEDAVRIAQKTVKQLVQRLKYFYNVELRFSPSALTTLMGYFNEAEGGRSMRRSFDNFFRAPIARLVYENKVPEHTTLLMSADPKKGLQFVTGTAEQVSAAEKAANQGTPEQNALKERLLLSRGGQTDSDRAARAATGELIRKFFPADWIVSESAFRSFFK